MNELNIPESWAETELKCIAAINMGQSPDGHTVSEDSAGVPLIGGAANIRHHKIVTNSFTTKPTKLCYEGDLIYCVRATIGKIAVADRQYCIGRGVAAFTSKIDADYLKFLLQSNISDVQDKATGSTFVQVDKKTLELIKIPLPPQKEQERIVQKIESCFAKIDATEANLNKVETLLEKYRESLLAKAFRGELVPQVPNDEPAGVLLEEIRKERSQNVKGKKAEQEFAPITDEDKPFELPMGWEWVLFEQITENLDGKRVPIKSTDRKTTIGNYPYYGASGIIDYVDDFIFEGEHLLISEDGANLLARTYPISFVATGKFWVNNHAHVVKALSATSNRFLELYFESLDISRWVTGAAQPKFNQAKLNSVPVPLPPIREQERILTILSEKLKTQEVLLNEIRKKKSIIPKMKDSILQKAFEGRLVEQIPSEGTGHELLAKILAEKESTQNSELNEKSKKTIKKASAKKAVATKGK